jgi:hypothetical protein
MRVAVDDTGNGFAGLTRLVDVCPEPGSTASPGVST